MLNDKHGTLYVVATPIGNLQDMTLRAIETLKKVDKIAAEDTRHAGPLLKHFSITRPIIALHDYNEREKMLDLINVLLNGESIALISDAGTPLINDPGYHLVKLARAEGIKVVPIPGACALIAAISAAGLPTDKFTFEGFLPAKTEPRCNALATLKHESRTIIFYEAPHRLLVSLHSMAKIFGSSRIAVVARELTKLYETILTDTLANLIQHFEAHPTQVRGEIVILVTGSDEAQSLTKEVVPAEVLDILLTELPIKQAAALASRITGERKNILYEMALARKGG